MNRPPRKLQHLRPVLDFLEEAGCDAVSIDVARRHPRIFFTHAGRTRFVAVSGTNRDIHHRVINDIKKELIR